MHVRRLLTGLLVIAGIGLAQNAAAEITWSGAIRNDLYVFDRDGQAMAFDLLENQLVLQRSTPEWRFYGDLRVNLYRGDLAGLADTGDAELPPELMRVRVLRGFVRYFSEAGDITVGKTYVNFGVAGLFNPFELDRAYNVTDVGYTREGVIAVTDEIAFGDLAGLKLYLSPSADNSQMAGGADAHFHVGSFDAGVVGQRVGRDNTVIGAYAKGDLELGVQAAAACHLDDHGSYRYAEAAAGADYSFGEGKWVATVLGYYNGGAAVDRDSLVPLGSATAFSSRFYVYADLRWAPDEFSQARVSCLVNASDGSSLVIPSATWMLADGLSLNLQALVPTGTAGTQYSSTSLGRVIGLARVEAKL